jgi:RNA-binding protein
LTPSPSPLSGADRKYLRALAHHLDPLVQIGKSGLAPNVLAAIAQAFEHHELIKIRFLDFKEQKRELARIIAQQSNSELVGMIGHVGLFYRQHPDPEQRQIHFPRRHHT